MQKIIIIPENPNSELRIPNPESRTPNSESRIPNPERENPESRIPNPEPRNYFPQTLQLCPPNPSLALLRAAKDLLKERKVSRLKWVAIKALGKASP